MKIFGKFLVRKWKFTEVSIHEGYLRSFIGGGDGGHSRRGSGTPESKWHTNVMVRGTIRKCILVKSVMNHPIHDNYK